MERAAFEHEWAAGLPRLVSTPVQEMWKSSNLSFSLCPLLTQGAVELCCCAVPMR